MDLFRSKKRDNEFALLGDLSSPVLKKKHRGLSGSLNDLLDVDQDVEEGQDTTTDHTTSSESEGEELQKASRKQKIFAKKVIKREKQKRKEQKKKVEKNMLSMDDFLRKQSEFKSWLCEEKSKNAGDLASPKLKAYFKQFVRCWNKRKLPQKYYRTSSISDSPTTPITPRKFNFLSEDPGDSDTETVAKDPPKSPFVTFGKTPPKMFKSKKLQLLNTTKDVALISIAPIGSPQVAVMANKELIGKPCQYHVPKADTTQLQQYPEKTNHENDVSDNNIMKGAIPYKVSVFPWAIGNPTDCDLNHSLVVCSTATPPNRSFGGGEDEDSCSTPTSELEPRRHNYRRNNSPHVPPPPPPRLESLPKPDFLSKINPPLSDNYADPYDELPKKWYAENMKILSEYQEPVDMVVTKNSRTIPDNARQVVKSLCSHTKEPDKSLYLKPVAETRKKLSKEELEKIYSKPLKRLNKFEPVFEKMFSRDELEKMYAKPLKQSEKTDPVLEHASNKDNNEVKSELYAEIMSHLNKRKSGDVTKTSRSSSDPHYETIDECFTKTDNDHQDLLNKKTDLKTTGSVHKADVIKKSEHGFAELTKAKKKRVLAASSDKIYETYLSIGHNVNPFKIRPEKLDVFGQSGGFTQILKKKYISQPDIAFGEGMHVHEADEKVLSNADDSKAFISIFKPVDSKYDVNDNHNSVETNVKLSVTHRAKSYDGFRNISIPGTPTIMATPSFDSLCAVTSLSCRSGSSQSLPAKSSSSESLSYQDSFPSTSTSSSLSFAPDEKFGSLQSLHSEKSLSPVPEENDEKVNEEKHETLIKPPERKVDKITIDFSKGLIPMTPGKISAAKHGIDLSVYLLNPLKQVDNATKCCHSNTDEPEKNINNVNHFTCSVAVSDENTMSQFRNLQEAQFGSKFIDTQSRLAIKETLAGVKTKVDQSKTPGKKETERRHTVQTVHDFKASIIHKSNTPTQVPDIGIVAKARKIETFHKLGKTKWQQSVHIEEIPEPDSKRHCGEATKVVGIAEDQYLETDLDMVVMERGKQSMKKSKSHSGFEQSSSSTSTVVTDIW